MNELSNNYHSVLEEKNTIWKVAIYVRLSREDEKDDKDKEQSESIENQIKFLKKIVNDKKWILVDIYKDDGYTGTNFDRPDFKRLLEDIEKGKINLVITKDLSRLGRDYIETGRFVEKYFPIKNVRYIAVNDNIDTFDKKNSNNDITPFKSVINDMYAKDISNKVRTAIYTKAQEGECIKSFLPYGYKKDINNKNKILIDEEVAKNIKMIFELYYLGNTKTQIAKKLNEMEIITPLKYKKIKTNYHNPNDNATYKWNSTVINKILRDRIYTGDLVQLKNQKINYKVKKTTKVPEEQHVVILNNHAAIIDKKKFNMVQEMLDKQANEWNYTGRKRHLLSGLVFCECGSRITYNKNHGKYFRCVCSSYKKYGRSFCTNVHMREDDLITAVTTSVKENIYKYLNMDDLKYKNKTNINEKEDIIKLSQKKEKLNRIISSLYEDKIANVISKDTFSNLIIKYENEKKECEKKLKVLESQKNIKTNEIKENQKELKKTMKKLLKFDEINEENKGIIFKLIDKIIIKNKEIIIQYKFNIA